MITLFTRKENGRTRTLASSGFTLVELMVSLTIFSIVMLVSVGTLLIIIDVNAKAQALYTATTNLSFALDNITRELRMGYHYRCLSSIPSPSQFLLDRTADCTESDVDYKFISAVREKDGVRIGYRILNGVIEQKIGTGQWLPVTSPDVVITKFKLFVDNAEESYYEVEGSTVTIVGDTDQPYIDLVIEGYVNNGLETDTDFSIQSRIIQRRLDLL